MAKKNDNDIDDLKDFKFLMNEIVSYTGKDNIYPADDKYEIDQRLVILGQHYYRIRSYYTNRYIKNSEGNEIFIHEDNLINISTKAKEDAKKDVEGEKYTKLDVHGLLKDCKIENAKITSVDLEMSDHECFDLRIAIEGECGGCVFGGYNLGHTGSFDGWEYGIEYIMRVMDTVGVTRLNDMVGKYVRVAYKDRVFKAIGNIIKDQWFSPEVFCKAKGV